MKIIDLEKRQGDFQMKTGSFSMEEGKIHGIIGGNGCGKTTLCKLIMGIVKPDRGRIDYEGLEIGEITMTAQRPYFIQGSVYENICYPLKIRRIRPDEQKIDGWLARCGLEEKKYQYARSLSSGEQQKVSMIRALIFDPKFIMIDETLSNLDPENLELFEHLILEIQNERPVTWLLISHRLAHIYKMCEVLHFMHQGEVLASGSRDEILFGSEDERIRRFVANEVIRMEEKHGAFEG